MKKAVAIGLMFLGILAGTAAADEVTLFGPQKYTRNSGAPDLFSDTFKAYPGIGRMVVKNGNQIGEKRIVDAISSAEILVNGVQIFGPNDFNQKVYLLEAQLILAAENSVTVELASKPGSYISVEILADLDPPAVSFSAVPDVIFSGQSSTLSWEATNADSCAIEPPVGPIDVNGSVSVSPAETTTYTLTATGLGGVGIETATVTVANRPPTADPQTVFTNEDTSVIITLSGSDGDGDALSYSVVAPPDHGELTGTPPGLTYSPHADYNGNDAFSFVVNDGSVDSEPASVSITVTAVNDAPVAAGQAFDLNEDEALAVALGASDVDGDPLFYEIVEGPAHGELSGAAPNLTYAPDENYNGEDSFSFKASDGQMASEPATPMSDPSPIPAVASTL